MSEPLIYTIKGNLPIASLAYSTAWDVQDGYFKFTETYKLGDEVVRQSAHVYDREGIKASAAVNSFGS